MLLARSVSSSCTSYIELLKRWRVGFRRDTLIYFSPESASVNSTRGLRDLLMASSTSMSCQERVRCLSFRSLERTWVMALCCSRTLSIMACLEPHLVGHSVLRECSGSFSCLCKFPLFFPTIGKAADELLADPHCTVDPMILHCIL